MKEELTTKMHGELKITNDEYTKHRCLSVLTLLNGKTNDETILDKYAELYNVTKADILKYKTEFIKPK